MRHIRVFNYRCHECQRIATLIKYGGKWLCPLCLAEIIEQEQVENVRG